MAAQRSEVIAMAPGTPTALEAKPLKRNPRKNISSKSGAATTRASHSSQSEPAELYAAAMNSETTGRPRTTVSASDNTSTIARIPSHGINDRVETGFNAK